MYLPLRCFFDKHAIPWGAIDCMEYLHNGFTLELAEGEFPLSTDSIALADFVKLPKNARVLDLGSGCGTLGLMLCAKDAACSVTGVELSHKAHEMALRNTEQNHISHRYTSICADLKTIPDFIPAGSFQVCISNPPYFTGGLQSKTYALARHDDACSLQDLFQAAGWALRYGGDFFLVHKPEYLAEICAAASNHHLEPKRLRLLRHREDGAVSLILLQCRKGGKPGLIWEDASLRHADGSTTDYCKRLYHL